MATFIRPTYLFLKRGDTFSGITIRSEHTFVDGEIIHTERVKKFVEGFSLTENGATQDTLMIRAKDSLYPIHKSLQVKRCKTLLVEKSWMCIKTSKYD